MGGVLGPAVPVAEIQVMPFAFSHEHLDVVDRGPLGDYISREMPGEGHSPLCRRAPGERFWAYRNDRQADPRCRRSHWSDDAGARRPDVPRSVHRARGPAGHGQHQSALQCARDLYEATRHKEAVDDIQHLPKALGEISYPTTPPSKQNVRNFGQSWTRSEALLSTRS